MHNFKRDKNLELDFRDYKSLKEFFIEILYHNISIGRTEDIQKEFNEITALEKYRTTDFIYKKEKLKLLDNAKNLYDGREIIINEFKNGIFPLYFRKEKFEGEVENEDEDEDKYENSSIIPLKKLLFKRKREINNELIYKNFQCQDLEVMLDDLNKTKNTYNNGVNVSLIRSGLRDLRNEIKQMSKHEKEAENPDEVVNLVEKIVDFNNQNQEGQGLKILTPDA